MKNVANGADLRNAYVKCKRRSSLRNIHCKRAVGIAGAEASLPNSAVGHDASPVVVGWPSEAARGKSSVCRLCAAWITPREARSLSSVWTMVAISSACFCVVWRRRVVGWSPSRRPQHVRTRRRLRPTWRAALSPLPPPRASPAPIVRSRTPARSLRSLRIELHFPIYSTKAPTAVPCERRI